MDIKIPYTIHCGIFHFRTHSQFTSVELNYLDEENLFLTLILPNENVGIKEVWDSLSRNKLFFLSNFPSLMQIEIHLPMIELRMNIDLSYILQLAGLAKVFDAEQANLSGLVSNSLNLCFESILFNTDLALNGNFKEPSAPANNKTDIPDPFPVIFNRPFIYLITFKTKSNRSRVVLFAGIVNNVVDCIN